MQWDTYRRLAEKELRKPNFYNSLTRTGDNISKFGSSMTKRITVPILLFFAGLLFFPLGIILWIIAVAIMFGPSKQKQ